MKIVFVTFAQTLLALGLASSSAYAGMTLTEQHAEAKRLQNLCAQNSDVLSWSQQAANGSQRASYEAAALIQCYYDNVDPRYPATEKQQWLAMIDQNKKQAAALQ